MNKIKGIEERGSTTGEFSTYDKISTIIYGSIFLGATALTEIINKIMPYLKLDVVVLNTNFITMTLGNVVTVVIALLGVFTKKFLADKSNIIITK